jgi:hypothetical protein
MHKSVIVTYEAAGCAPVQQAELLGTSITTVACNGGDYARC